MNSKIFIRLPNVLVQTHFLKNLHLQDYTNLKNKTDSDYFM